MILPNYQYTYYGSYSNSEKFKEWKLNKILFKIKKDPEKKSHVSIESKYNGIYYPFFDLDTQDNLELFKTIYSENTPYVIFRSSLSDDEMHYWAILDQPTKYLQCILTNCNWQICNDSKYVKFSIEQKNLVLRGLYQNINRKPCIYETNKKLSYNFNSFIESLEYYYNNEGFEMSVFKYKDPDMLIKFNRKMK